MAAPKGNQFWRARSTHGKKPKFETPKILWEACVEYFEWVEANPLWESKLFPYQGDVTRAAMPKMRAMTLLGLCNFLDITFQNWTEYRSREGYSDICSRVDAIVRQQKFEGAAAELLNPSIIARDLGLADKKEMTGEDGGALVVQIVKHGDE